MKNEKADLGHLKKSYPKSLWARYLLNHWLDRITICCSLSLGISNDLVNFGNNSLKNKIADGGHLEKYYPVGVFFY